MTNLSDIERLINLGESETLEFKSSFNNETIETLVAFANTSGGRVLIGINDQGKPISNFVVSKETIPIWINEIKSKTTPSIIPNVEVLSVEGHTIVILSIAEFPVKPVALKGRFYKRVQNSNHLMNTNALYSGSN